MSEENVLFTIDEREYTAEDAQKKIENADSHIKTIEEENAELRKKMDEYMEALAKVEAQKPEPAEPAKAEESSKPELDAEAIAKLVEQVIDKRSQTSYQEDNLNTVKQTLLEQFGDEAYANEQFTEKAKDLGLTPEEAMELAKSKPKVVLNWFKGDVPVGGAAPSGRNTQAIASVDRGNKEGTWAWWQDLRRKDPKLYDSPNMARRRMQDAERLGREGFFGKK